MNILIIDDHKVVIDGISNILNKQSNVSSVTAANSSEEGLKHIEQDEFDLLLLDINLPKINGIEICQKAKKMKPSLPILALSMHHEPAIIQKMIKAGANGYLLKDSGSDELLKAIKSINDEGQYFSESVGKSMLQSWSGATDISNTPKLTRREKEVLELIINEKTTEEIGKLLHIQETTVTTHRQNLLSKLGARNTAGLVRIAMELNLLNK